MSDHSENLMSSVLALPVDERQEFAQALIESLTPPETNTPEYIRTIGSRLDDLRSGRVVGIPAEVIFPELATEPA